MSLVARWILPLSACPSANPLLRMHFAKRRRLQNQTLIRMLAQSGRAKAPLPGRPLILAVRESSREIDPDQAASWLKLPLDCLKTKGGLGFLRDDSGDCVEIKALWAKAAPRKGQCIIELWEDKNMVRKPKKRAHLLGRVA